ncbi:hypothetical protein CAEBREN_17113 [Caenorhabditis brenneri]|uniref:Uncharacterized protein n=1 Tax=Caenorhabditis brenneri TaxID=135651 RepID=G0NB01_CAEBE|nr:hypothetical protein CAEBREN_17113 [Caenorhabditis brenneri]
MNSRELEVGVELDLPLPTYEQTMAMGGADHPPRYESIGFNTSQQHNKSE